MRTAVIGAAVLTICLGSIAISGVTEAKEPVNQTLLGGVAIRGTDPVAYFTEGRPVRGDRKFQLEWREAVWRFASAEHLEMFRSDPERYAPQYGGYCAWAVSQGYTAGIDPEAWKIVDGRLYLNYSREVQETWERDIPGNIRLADRNYPGLVDGR